MKRTTTLFKMMLGLGMLIGLSANAQITVTNTNNSGAGSLRQAVIDAEAGSTIMFDADIDGNTIMLENEIEIDKNLTIQGNGDENTIISGSDETRIFMITDAEVNIEDVTLTDGSADDSGGAIWASGSVVVISNATISGNEAHGDSSTHGGGGIYIEDGELTLNSSIVTDNEATGDSGSGGGILIGTEGSATINSSEISANFASRAGGGIEFNSGNDSFSLTLNDVTIDANTTGNNPGNGGGLHVTGDGSVTLTGGVVTNNSGSQGGGLWNSTGIMTIANVEIDGNTATGMGSNDGGGGIYNNGGTLSISASTVSNNEAEGLFGQGGGIHLNGGTTSMVKTTLSGNSAFTNGGGIFNNGELMLNANTIAENTALVNGGGIMNSGSNMLSIKNSIVAENTALLGTDLFGEDEDVESEGYNLIGNLDADIFASLESDIMGTLENPLDFDLLDLSDNGGSTRTHRLACPSPAADAGDPEDSSTDQLNQSVFNGRRDIGAYEEQEMCSTADVEDFDSATASVVYPNPSLNGLVNLELSANHGIGATVSIYEIASGKLVKQMSADNMSMQIGVNNLATGTYVMQIVSDRATETHKFIVGK